MQKAILDVDREIGLGASHLNSEHTVKVNGREYQLWMCLALEHASLPKVLVESLGWCSTFIVGLG